MRAIRPSLPEGVVAAQVGLGAGVVLCWQLLAGAGVLDPFFFSRPSAVAARVWQWLASGFLHPHLMVTLLEAFYGLALGALAGLAAGFVLARSPVLDQVINPYVRMLNAMPRVVLAPIFLLWFGLGIWSKVAFAVTLVFFVVFFNTYQGVRDVDAVVLDNARMLGASPGQLTRHVLAPSALTWIFSSLHVSVGFAIVGAVVGEYLGASRGVGYVIAQAEGLFDTTGVFAGMAVLLAVVLVVDHLVNRLERRLLRWKHDPTQTRPAHRQRKAA